MQLWHVSDFKSLNISVGFTDPGSVGLFSSPYYSDVQAYCVGALWHHRWVWSQVQQRWEGHTAVQLLFKEKQTAGLYSTSRWGRGQVWPHVHQVFHPTEDSWKVTSEWSVSQTLPCAGRGIQSSEALFTRFTAPAASGGKVCSALDETQTGDDEAKRMITEHLERSVSADLSSAGSERHIDPGYKMQVKKSNRHRKQKKTNRVPSLWNRAENRAPCWTEQEVITV